LQSPSIPTFCNSGKTAAHDERNDSAKRKENAEFEQLVAASGRNQTDTAAYLTRRLGKQIANYQVSRWSSGAVKVPTDVMDAMRELAAQPVEAPPVISQLTDTSDVVPLFGYANAAGSTLRLNEDQRVGVVPIHPAQRGSRSAFAFLVFGDSLSPRLNHGETGYAVRNKTPVKGQPVLIEMVSGDVLVKLFERVDEHTVFCAQLTPKKDLTFKLVDVKAMHAVVGATYL
jgi:hypothetical protein